MENDVYDEQIDTQEAIEQEQETQATPKDEPKQETQSGGKYLSDDEYEDFARMRQERTLNEMEREFQMEYPDFKMSDVLGHIKEVQKENPALAERLFTPVGIENIYLKHFKGKKSADDEFDTGRAISGSANSDEMISKINRGEASDSEKLNFYKRLF